VQVLKLKINFSSISVQLLVLVLIITIVPITILTYTNDRVLTENVDAQLQGKINDSSVMVSQAYMEKMKNDRTEAIVLSHDLGLISGIRSGNHTAVKSIVDSYFSDAPVNFIVTVIDSNGIVLARSATEQNGDVTTNDRLLMALRGNGSSVTDVLPAQVIIANKLWDQVNATGMTDGLALINTEPVRDENRTIIGAVSISEVLNNNFDIVDMITNQTGGVYCTIFQNDTRIATTLMDTENKRIVGTRLLPEIAIPVLYGQQNVDGIYNINNLTLYTHYEPIFNDHKEVVGMLFVGYDVMPGYQKLDEMRLQAVITGLVASVVFVIIGYLLVRTITRPIKQIVAIANSIAAGNLDTPVETEATGGEIGELSTSIRQMVGYMVTNIKERMNYNEAVLKGISDPMLVVDRDGRITFFNEPASALTGVSSAEAIGKLVGDVTKAGDSGGIQECIRTGEAVQGFEDTIVTRGGRTAIVRGSSAPLKDADGKAIGTILLLHDITREKEADERIKASLKEKEVLLKEIHHRVKNNLQIISSLLNLQSTYITDGQALGMFKESQNRVRSMALIHEKLYQSKDIARIDFAEYIRNLTGNLVRSYGFSPVMVKLIIDADHISLGVDTAIPCGLIINELVTNSLKYAFPDGRNGEIRITLKQDNGDGRYWLSISDDGRGLPESIELRKTSTLGLQLVTTLVDQLNGTIEVKRENGTEFIIRFSELKARDTHREPRE
jgi:PAS domain S-box-containing protein